ncbi:MAG: nicotinamide mononucleotide transporter [Flavobacteriales bacterium]|nr:nicotinamide mononucleotide transporter [Flavobacteriales bacterium]
MELLKSRDGIIEIISVVFSLLYTVLYIDQSPWAFLFGALGAAGFVYLCFQKKIYAESALQLFYVGMAIYGYLNLGAEWGETHWSWSAHAYWIVAGVIVTIGLGTFLKRNTGSKATYLDAFTTVFAVIATVLMMEFVVENWLYWIVINAVSSVLYFRRKLYFGSVLFAIYMILAIKAYFF